MPKPEVRLRPADPRVRKMVLDRIKNGDPKTPLNDPRNVTSHPYGIVGELVDLFVDHHRRAVGYGSAMELDRRDRIGKYMKDTVLRRTDLPGARQFINDFWDDIYCGRWRLIDDQTALQCFAGYRCAYLPDQKQW